MHEAVDFSSFASNRCRGASPAHHFIPINALLMVFGPVSVLLAQSPVVPGSHRASYLNASLPMERRADDLVAHMTLEEKVSQMENVSPPIPRLGIPGYHWWNEGLHGVANSGYATVFPQAIGMAASWDAPLIHDEGRIIGIEGRSIYNSAVLADRAAPAFGLDFWAPNINIFRDPRWGRGQETYGEDPFLTGRLAVQFIRGMQGSGSLHDLGIATPKHFDVHSGPESERHRFNVNVSPHDLEDTYLPAFRAAIVDGHAGSVMCAYSAIDGIPACASKMLLQTYLRDKWKFDGYIVSDCGAVGNIAKDHQFAPNLEQAAADALHAGTDLSCGKQEYAPLVQAVEDGFVKESEIDAAVKRLLLARMEVGALFPAHDQAYQSLNRNVVYSPQHAALNLRAAEESMVLLKNDGILPLRRDIHTIAVIGPNAASLAALEGNYNGTPIDPKTPLAAFKAVAAQQHIHILDAQGAPCVNELSLPVPPSAFHPLATDHAEGLTVTYFPNSTFSGKGITAHSENIETNWNAASPLPKSIPLGGFSARWTGTFTAPAPGDYGFQVEMPSCRSCDNSYAIWFDGKQVSRSTVHNPRGALGLSTPMVSVHFADTLPHAFRMEYAHSSKLLGAGVSLNWKLAAETLREQAVALARQSDAVVAIVGISPRLEGEQMPLHIDGFSGGDRTSIALPAVQQQMLQAVAATGKPLIVVLMNGSPLAINWAQQHASAILEAWYPGARGGEAIVNTLLGRNNPAGRLPVTFYASVDDLPAFTDYSMANRTYRYFKGESLYAFGYGLSYSRFAFSQLALSKQQIAAGDSLTVEVDVTNLSKIAGDEVAELYLKYPSSQTAPIHALAGFDRVHLAPDVMHRVRFTLSARELSQVLPSGERVVLPGSYEVFIGGSQPGNHAEGVSGSFTIAGRYAITP
jgi:beta-glucosidase